MMGKFTSNFLFQLRPVPPPRTIKPSHPSTSSPSPAKHQQRPESDFNLSRPPAPPSIPASSFPGDGVGQLPDRHRSLHMPLVGNGGGVSRRPQLAMSDEVHDYSEIYTPSNEGPAASAEKGNNLQRWVGTTAAEAEAMSMGADSGGSGGGRTGSGDSGLTGLSSSGTAGTADEQQQQQPQQQQQQDPPPPPLHRYPSWEDRIYQVASEAGLPTQQQQQVHLRHRDGSSGNNNSNRNSLCGFGDDISVPVYASVKGVRKS